jgi:hypothetical protein
MLAFEGSLKSQDNRFYEEGFGCQCRPMSHLLELNLENGISLVLAGRQEVVEHPPVILLSNHHQENEEPI